MADGPQAAGEHIVGTMPIKSARPCGAETAFFLDFGLASAYPFYLEIIKIKGNKCPMVRSWGLL